MRRRRTMAERTPRERARNAWAQRIRQRAYRRLADAYRWEYERFYAEAAAAEPFVFNEDVDETDESE